MNRRIIIAAAIIFYVGCMAYAAIASFPIAAADAPPPSPLPVFNTAAYPGWIGPRDCPHTAANWRAMPDDARMHRIGCDSDDSGHWMPMHDRCARIAYRRYQLGIAIDPATMIRQGCHPYEDGTYRDTANA